MGAFQPDIENLKRYVSENGNTVKNYKELCKILGIKYSKRIDRGIELLSSYVELHRFGNSIKVVKFNEKPIYVPQRKSKYKSNIAIILQYIFKNEGSLYIEKTTSELQMVFGYYTSIIKELIGALYKTESEEYVKTLDDIRKLKNEFLGDSNNTVNEVDLLKKLIRSAKHYAYHSINDALINLREEGFIDFSKGYCMMSRNSVDYVFEGDNYYFDILDSEEKILANMNSARFSHFKERRNQFSSQLQYFHDLKMYEAKNWYQNDFYTNLIEMVNRIIRNAEIDLPDNEKSPEYMRISTAYRIVFGEKYEMKDVSYEEYRAARFSINENLVKRVFDKYETGQEVPEKTDDENLELFTYITTAEGMSEASEKFDSYPKDIPYIDRLKAYCKDEGLYLNEDFDFIPKTSMHNDADLGLYQLLMILFLCHSKEDMLSELRARKQMQKDLKNGKFCLDKPLKKISSKNPVI